MREIKDLALFYLIGLCFELLQANYVWIFRFQPVHKSLFQRCSNTIYVV